MSGTYNIGGMKSIKRSATSESIKHHHVFRFYYEVGECWGSVPEGSQERFYSYFSKLKWRSQPWRFSSGGNGKPHDSITGEPNQWQIQGIDITVLYGSVDKVHSDNFQYLPKIKKNWFSNNPDAKCPSRFLAPKSNSNTNFKNNKKKKSNRKVAFAEADDYSDADADSISDNDTDDCSASSDDNSDAS